MVFPSARCCQWSSRCVLLHSIMSILKPSFAACLAAGPKIHMDDAGNFETVRLSPPAAGAEAPGNCRQPQPCGKPWDACSLYLGDATASPGDSPRRPSCPTTLVLFLMGTLSTSTVVRHLNRHGQPKRPAAMWHMPGCASERARRLHGIPRCGLQRCGTAVRHSACFPVPPQARTTGKDSVGLRECDRVQSFLPHAGCDHPSSLRAHRSKFAAPALNTQWQ